MSKPLTPISKWHQSPSFLFLTLEALQPSNLFIEIKDDNQTLIVKCNSTSIQVREHPSDKKELHKSYYLELKLYNQIEKENIVPKLTPHSIVLSLTKLKSEEWPRLTELKERNNRIKIDWEKWESSQNFDDDEQCYNEDFHNLSSNQKFEALKPIKNRAGQDANPTTRSPVSIKSPAAKDFLLASKGVYLKIYNALCLALWSYIFFIVFTNALLGKSLNTIHPKVYLTTIIARIMALFEILHAKFKISETHFLPNLMFRFSRDFVMFFCIPFLISNKSVSQLIKFPSLDSMTYVAILLYLTWSVTDMTRFSHNLIQEMKVNHYIAKVINEQLTYIRYVFPLFLMPIGILLELVLIYSTFITLETEWVRFLLVVYTLFAYLIGGPKLYMAIWSQKRKKLDFNGSKQAKKA